MDDADVSRQDWERALDQVFGCDEVTLDPLEIEAHPIAYLVDWVIDQDAKSAAEPAAGVWRQIFRRGPWQPNNGEACVLFTSEKD